MSSSRDVTACMDPEFILQAIRGTVTLYSEIRHVFFAVPPFHTQKHLQDSMLFQTAPSCQDSIEMLSNCEWDSQRSERLGLTKPEEVVVAREE
jgi:hypothetical protein